MNLKIALDKTEELLDYIKAEKKIDNIKDFYWELNTPPIEINDYRQITITYTQLDPYLSSSRVSIRLKESGKHFEAKITLDASGPLQNSKGVGQYNNSFYYVIKVETVSPQVLLRLKLKLYELFPEIPVESQKFTFS